MEGHWKVRDPYEFLLPVDVTVCGRHVMWCCVVGGGFFWERSAGFGHIE